MSVYQVWQWTRSASSPGPSPSPASAQRRRWRRRSADRYSVWTRPIAGTPRTAQPAVIDMLLAEASGPRRQCVLASAAGEILDVHAGAPVDVAADILSKKERLSSGLSWSRTSAGATLCYSSAINQRGKRIDPCTMTEWQWVPRTGPASQFGTGYPMISTRIDVESVARWPSISRTLRPMLWRARSRR